MNLPLRFRIQLTLVPLLLLLFGLGGAGVALLFHLGGRIDAILRENYDSVIAMERLNEALERVDSSFQFALAGLEEKGREQYKANWGPYDDALHLEQHNITLPGEQEMVDKLVRLTESYREKGDEFYAGPAKGARRHQQYFGTGGLLAQFKAIKDVSGDIRRLNQRNMEDANQEAKRTARAALLWFGVGLAAAVLLAGLAAWHTLHTILRPIQAVTRSALAIGQGNLDQVVPVGSFDELGQLAEAFNVMARQLRHYRQSGLARLLRAQRTSQATIDSFPDPVLVVDTEGRMEMANPAACRLFGIAADQGEPRSALPWQPPEPLRQPLTDALQKQRPYLPEGFSQVIPLHADGQDSAFLPRILPIQDPYHNTLGAAVLLEDVTRFRLLDQVKSDLVATVSHELKTPLTSIRLALYLLLEEQVGALTAKQTELLLDARDNAERLLARVNSLLDLARLEQGPAQLDLLPEAPADLLRAAADAARPRAADKGLEIVVDAPFDLPAVTVDSQRLGHALDNLLDNAITYTNPGGRIRLAAARAGEMVSLSVTDTGIGIPAAYLPHVFDRFFRVPGQTRGAGTGLGLAIVREIVQAHGGTIHCESDPGSGTTFQMMLPVWQGARVTA